MGAIDTFFNIVIYPPNIRNGAPRLLKGEREFDIMKDATVIYLKI